MDSLEEITAQFRTNGFAVIRSFWTPEEVDRAKRAAEHLVHKYCEGGPRSVFTAASDDKKGKPRDNYFAESGDKIRGFYEDTALNGEGEVKVNQTSEALNKIGHALHQLDPFFHEVTLSPKVAQVVGKVTNMKEPTVAQSMVIFKNPKIGGEVKPHQDSSFLYLDPTPGSLLGFWIALDGANQENGCLHFVPSSHLVQKEPYKRFIKNPDSESPERFIYKGDDIPSDPAGFVAVPVDPGDLVLIDGLVIHKSDPNTSELPRKAYTWHIIDGRCTYSSENWLQNTSENNFIPLRF